MASGHVNRTNRPNTWLHRPPAARVKKVLANPEPSTHGPSIVRIRFRQDSPLDSCRLAATPESAESSPGKLRIARGAASALPAAAISHLGAFRMPAAGVRGESLMPASENLTDSDSGTAYIGSHPAPRGWRPGQGDRRQAVAERRA